MGYGALVGGLVGGAKDNNSGGGNNNTGIVGNTLGISAGLDARDKKREKRAQQEAARQYRLEAQHNYEGNKRAQETMQDLLPEMTGNLQTDFISPGLVGPESRQDIGGGAFENVLDAAAGYSQVMDANPYMDIYGADRAAIDQLEGLADWQTNVTLEDWKANQGKLLGEYQTQADELGAKRDQMRDSYTTAVEEDRAAEQEDMAKLIVEAWIASNDKGGAAGNEDFIDRRSKRANNVATMLTGIGRMPRKKGKAKGADEGAKEAYIDDLLADGASYEDILSDPEMQKYFEADENTRTLYGSWDG